MDMLILIISMILFTSVGITNALIDLNYCNSEQNKIDRIVKKSDDFDFDVRMEEFYHTRLNFNKSIPCCAPRGSKIRWLYGGKPLKETNSTFRVWPGDHRYIVTSNVTEHDVYSLSLKQEYQCIVTHPNYPQTLIHTLHLHTTVVPFTMNDPEKDFKKAIPGEEVILRCSQFLGFDTKIAPFMSVEWNGTSTHYNSTYLNNETVKKEYVYSAAGEVNYISTLKIKIDELILKQNLCFICYFKLNGTIPEIGYGMFGDNKCICIKHYVNPVADIVQHYNVILIGLGIVLFFFIVITITLLQYHIEIRLIIKDKFGRIETSDDNDTDVFVCYNCNNNSYCAHAVFINKNLVPHLENTLGYSCWDVVRDANGGDYIPETMQEEMLRSRRLILVLCDDLLKDNFYKLVCRSAINASLQRKLPIICILPKKSEREAITDTDNLSSALRTVLNVAHKVTWPGKDASPRQYNNFWKRLRLHLPPRRHLIQRINV